MKTYELIIDETKESGVDFIALVDRPAIESNWEAFKEVKQQFKIEDEDKRIVSGYFMIADKPIYRNNQELGEHNVIFSGETIKQIAYKFMRNGFNSNTNLMHEQELKLSDVFIFESLLIDSERGVYAPDNFEKVADGSWWGSMHVMNDKVWNLIKEGKFQGFSVEGFFNYKNEESEKMRKIEEILKSDQLTEEEKEEAIINLF